MAFWLASARDGQNTDWIQRFDPRFWTINFPRPMLAAITVPVPDTLRVDATFLQTGDLAGLIWESVDSADHPLLAYDTDRDYSRTALAFHWKSSGVLPLDAVNGPTLTIEGVDSSGTQHTWYVRLWNYATGTPEDADIVLPFSALSGGWALGSGTDPVNPVGIERMFVSLVAPGYASGGTTPLAAPVDGWVEFSAMRCSGDRAMLVIGDVAVPPTGIALATAYDDCCTLTPARLIRNAVQLGYRGSLLHYVGMSHHMRLAAAPGGFAVPGSGDPLAGPARAWHGSFLAEAKAAGFSPILSASYELLAQYCPDAWQQRAAGGDPARTGWDPPSALLSPANSSAMAWLASVWTALVGLMRDAGVAPRCQIGEPWWWVMPDGRPCLYNSAAVAALGGSPVAIADLRQPLSAAQTALLDAAGAVLAASTAGLRDAIRAAAAPQPAEVLLLTFLPTVLDPAMPELVRANLPAGWASPAFDRLQIEDYDWLTTGADGARAAAYAAIDARLGYPSAGQDYLAGFVLLPSQTDQWRRIDSGLDEAQARGAHECFVWAYPQVNRDGYLRLPTLASETAMTEFDDVSYPLALGRNAAITPEFSTSVAVTASGFERRNSLWSDARLTFDVGPGIRSDAELGVLLAFFRARRGAARGFRLRDPTDFSSNAMTAAPTMGDQLLGLGDGVTTRFALVKRYGTGDAEQVRRITRPDPASILISVDGQPVTTWTLEATGIVVLAAAPASGSAVRAGFVFDVPVRFNEDKLAISGAAFAAGEAPSVPIIEIREATV